jgi:AraC-like DNA-binding protein
MKPYYSRPTSEFDSCITIRKDVLNYFYNRWHYHDELELVYVMKSSGTQYTGDHIRQFVPGELTILGSMLPHNWVSDDEYYSDDNELMVEAVVLHVKKCFIQNDFMKLPEMGGLLSLFRDARRGVLINDISPEIEGLLLMLPELKGTGKVLKLLELFYKLSELSNKTFLASNGYIENTNYKSNERLFKVYEFVANNYRRKISLQEIAAEVHMNPNAFCSYFKRRTAQSIFEYIIQMRLGYAKKLLIRNDLSIEQIAFKSGFISISLFNRQFKSHNLMTPMEYKRQYNQHQ